MRFFNTAGPSKPEHHYCLDPLRRIKIDEIFSLIEAERYFVLHAPRQTGKTTCLLALMKRLNESGRYRAAYVNVESAQGARNNVSDGMRAIVSSFAARLEISLGDRSFIGSVGRLVDEYGPNGVLEQLLRSWTAQEPARPTVLLLDEIDALVGDTLISVLRQIRAGYTDRPGHFPQSVLLCGVRDVRDYRIQSANLEIITGGSAFNIKAKSLLLGNFTSDDIRELYGQHTAATGQSFAEELFDLLWQDTAGQPWLVNALGQELCFETPEGMNRSRPVTVEQYREARERLIQRRDTHLDQLTDKLREERVYRVISAILAGSAGSETIPTDDMSYVEDLGLITVRPGIAIANGIYSEVIPRELIWTRQVTLAQETAWYVTPDHRLDLPKLLRAFQQFYLEKCEAWLERFQYKEAGPQLLLQAFLQRIINGGGRISREYGLGRGRTDLFIEWPLDEARGFHGPLQRIVIELKLLHKSRELTVGQGVEQITGYAVRCQAEECHLVLFDRSSGIEPEAKLFEESCLSQGRTILVWGM